MLVLWKFVLWQDVLIKKKKKKKLWKIEALVFEWLSWCLSVWLLILTWFLSLCRLNSSNIHCTTLICDCGNSSNSTSSCHYFTFLCKSRSNRCCCFWEYYYFFSRSINEFTCKYLQIQYCKKKKKKPFIQLLPYLMLWTCGYSSHVLCTTIEVQFTYLASFYYREWLDIYRCLSFQTGS